MAGITKEQAQAQLDLYLAAEAAVLASQSYEIDGRKLTRADLRWVQAGVKTWNERATNLGRTRGRSRTVVVGG